MDNYGRLRRIGGLLFSQGLISLSAGNISIRFGDYFCITASGALLGDLKRDDIVKLPLSDSSFPPVGVFNRARPSVEAKVHKSIYLNTPAKAVVHAHPPAALALACDRESIEPRDAEGRFYIGQVPVIEVADPISSDEAAEQLPALLEMFSLVLVRNHGVFGASDTPEKAASLVSTLEFSCRQIVYRKIIKNL